MNLVLTTIGRQFLLTNWFVRDHADATATLYVAYTASVPASNADVTQLDEPAGSSGYVRQGLPLDSSHWSPTGYGEVFNSWAGDIATLTASVGYLSGIALLDAASGGNVIGVGVIAEPFRADAGVTLALDVADITIGLYE